MPVWGFVRAGDSVDKDNRDLDTGGINDERLCWHFQDGAGGYRCGAAQDIFDNSYERIVYMLALPRLTPIPTLSEWGLTVMAGILGIAGFMVLRRRKVVA